MQRSQASVTFEIYPGRIGMSHYKSPPVDPVHAAELRRPRRSMQRFFRIIRRAVIVALAAAAALAVLPISAPRAEAQVHYLEMQNRATGRCLEDSRASGLRARPCNNTSNQQWAEIPGSGPETLVNRNTGRCLDDSFEAGLRTFPCNSLDYQRWHLIVDKFPYLIYQNQRTAGCLDDSTQFGLRTFGCNNGIYQQWSAMI
jgi:hypothetical protein